MQISSRFTIAVHVIVYIYYFEHDHKITSEVLAKSINVNPVVIRRILQQLKSQDLIQVTRGSGGATLKKKIDQITLLEIYQIVECVDKGGLFRFHESPNTNCPIGQNIHEMLDKNLTQIQLAMEKEMQSITIADIIKNQ